MSEMILHIDSSQEETFRLLTHYFALRREEILVSNPPSYLKAKVPRIWSPLSEGKAEATVTKRNGGSHVNINFDFKRGYVEAFVLAIAIFVILPLSSFAYFTPVSNYYEVLGGISLVLTLFIGFMAFEGYNVHLTKKRIIDELRLINEFKFAQPPPPPPDS